METRFEEFEDDVRLAWVLDFHHAHKTATVFVVGGAVRDHLLGRPTHDLDLVITGLSKKKLHPWLQQRGQIVFEDKKFGTWKFIPFHDPTKTPLDIAFPRRETAVGAMGGYRHFVVHADPLLPIQEDLARRDFTVNAMAYNLRTDELVDPFDGQSDLRAKLIRAVGDPLKRFTEDLTRLLRAIRLASELGFTIEEKTWKAILGLSPKLTVAHDGRRVVPKEVVGHEIRKAFDRDPVRALDLLLASDIWNLLFPSRPLPQNWRAVFDALTSRAFADTFGPPTSTTALALLCTFWFSNGGRAVAWLKEASLHVPEIDHVTIARIVDVAAEKNNLSLAEVERTLLPITHDLIPFLRVLEKAHDTSFEAIKKHLHALGTFRSGNHDTLLTGEELVRHLPPGPLYKIILDAIRCAQIEGIVRTKKDALRYAEDLAARYDATWRMM